MSGVGAAHQDKLAVAEHSINHGHRIQFHNSSILATKTRYMDRIIREVIKSELNPYNINREGGFCLSKSWKHLIGPLKLSGHDPDTLGDADPYPNPLLRKQPQSHPFYRRYGI
jgi:hypothetical protein